MHVPTERLQFMQPPKHLLAKARYTEQPMTARATGSGRGRTLPKLINYCLLLSAIWLRVKPHRRVCEVATASSGGFCLQQGSSGVGPMLECIARGMWIGLATVVCTVPCVCALPVGCCLAQVCACCSVWTQRGFCRGIMTSQWLRAQCVNAMHTHQQTNHGRQV